MREAAFGARNGDPSDGYRSSRALSSQALSSRALSSRSSVKSGSVKSGSVKSGSVKSFSVSYKNKERNESGTIQNDKIISTVYTKSVPGPKLKNVEMYIL